jgi:hypothetical protein
MLSVAQESVEQYAVSTNAGQAVPPFAAGVRTQRERDCPPQPHVAEHAVQSCQASTWQSTGHGSGLQIFGHAVNPPGGTSVRILGFSSNLIWSTLPDIDFEVLVISRMLLETTTLSPSSQLREQVPPSAQNVVLGEKKVCDVDICDTLLDCWNPIPPRRSVVKIILQVMVSPSESE